MRSRKSERKLRRPRRRPRACRCTSSGKTSPSASTARPASGSSKPCRARPRGQQARAFADREPVLAQHVGEAVGTARCCRGTRASWRCARAGPRPGAARRPRSAARAGVRARAPPSVSSSRSSIARPRPAARRTPRGRRGPPPSSGGSPSARRSLVLAGARAEAPRPPGAPARARSPRPAGAGRPRAGPWRRGRAARGRRARPEAARARAPREARELAPAREALVEHRAAPPAASASRTRRRAAACSSASSGAVARCVSGSKRRSALDGVAEELDAHGLVGVGREDVEDAAAPRHLAGSRHGVLARVAALVERLEQDLGRQLVARAQLTTRVASRCGARLGRSSP